LFSGRWQDAASEYRTELALYKLLFDPKNTGALGLADGYINLGRAESLAGNPTTGLRLIRTGIDVVRSRVAPDPTDKDRAVLLGSAYVYEGQALESLGDERGALQSNKQAAALFESPALAVERVFDSLVAATYGKIAGALARLGNWDEARETYDKALAILGSQRGPEPPSLRVQYALLEIYVGLGRFESQSASQGSAPASALSNACKWYQKSRNVWLQMPVRNSISPSGFKVTDFNTISTELAKYEQTPQPR
jgi:tetratricopeptide (TPR) repeat protein